MYRPDAQKDILAHTKHSTGGQNANSDQLSVYVNDNNYKDVYKSRVLAPSNVFDSMGVNGGHAQEFINVFNTVDIAVMNGGLANGKIIWDGLGSARNNFGNWRNYGNVKVNNHVLLRPDDMVIKFSASQTFDNFWDAVMGNKLISAVDQVAQNARLLSALTPDNQVTPSVNIPKYKKVPVLKDISTLTMPSSLKFNFQFGQAGLFSAEEEVVKPIIAIASAFMARGTGEDGWVQGTAPSTEYAISEAVRRIAKGIFGSKLSDIKSEFEGDENSSVISDVAKGLTNIQNIMHTEINNAGRDLINSATYRGVTYRIGRMVLPPLIVKDVSFDFDFSTVDEYGFPYKGSVTLDGLESLVTANASMISFK